MCFLFSDCGFCAVWPVNTSSGVNIEISWIRLTGFYIVWHHFESSSYQGAQKCKQNRALLSLDAIDFCFLAGCFDALWPANTRCSGYSAKPSLNFSLAKEFSQETLNITQSWLKYVEVESFHEPPLKYIETKQVERFFYMVWHHFESSSTKWLKNLSKTKCCCGWMRLDVICFRFWMLVFGHVNTSGLGYPAKLSLHFSLAWERRSNIIEFEFVSRANNWKKMLANFIVLQIILNHLLSKVR